MRHAPWCGMHRIMLLRSLFRCVTVRLRTSLSRAAWCTCLFYIQALYRPSLGRISHCCTMYRSQAYQHTVPIGYAQCGHLRLSATTCALAPYDALRGFVLACYWTLCAQLLGSALSRAPAMCCASVPSRWNRTLSGLRTSSLGSVFAISVFGCVIPFVGLAWYWIQMAVARVSPLGGHCARVSHYAALLLHQWGI